HHRLQVVHAGAEHEVGARRVRVDDGLDVLAGGDADAAGGVGGGTAAGVGVDELVVEGDRHVVGVADDPDLVDLGGVVEDVGPGPRGLPPGPVGQEHDAAGRRGGDGGGEGVLEPPAADQPHGAERGAVGQGRLGDREGRLEAG